MNANIQTLRDGDTFTHDGLRFVVSIEHDHDHGTPWENEDGHGPVSAWGIRDKKKPGERVLSSAQRLYRFYDVAEATRIAKRDGWGLGEKDMATLAAKLGRVPTQGEITAEAVCRDFEHLRGWCNGDWHYVGVCVRHVTQDENEKYGYAVWGIESEASGDITEVAHELAAQCAADIRKELAEQYDVLKTTRVFARQLISDIRASATLRPAICTAVRQQLVGLVAQRSAAHARINELTA